MCDRYAVVICDRYIGACRYVAYTCSVHTRYAVGTYRPVVTDNRSCSGYSVYLPLRMSCFAGSIHRILQDFSGHFHQTESFQWFPQPGPDKWERFRLWLAVLSNEKRTPYLLSSVSKHCFSVLGRFVFWNDSRVEWIECMPWCMILISTQKTSTVTYILSSVCLFLFSLIGFDT